jgi:hypothetical protein
MDRPIRQVNMAGPPAPLSPETERRLVALFPPNARAAATKLLTNECGTNLPFCKNYDEFQLERIRFAALKLSKGDMGRFRAAIELAKVDWRDVLLQAGFAWRVDAYKKWFPE